jgi:hypothetical protein
MAGGQRPIHIYGMYSACLFCHRSLGSNETIEAFPVGRRLAFDPARGRLWVVCRSCERWNLTPLEERWEAVEQAERIFREARLRASTENVGLARVAEGFDLVRIGRPLRPELAAWRYGDQFGRRRRHHVLFGAGALAASLALSLGGTIIGGTLVGGMIYAGSGHLFAGWRPHHDTISVRSDEGITLTLEPQHLREAELVRLGSSDGWALDVAHRDWGTTIRTPSGRRHLGPFVRLTGDAARRAARLVLPRLNHAGGGARQVAGAVRLLEAHGSGDDAFRSLPGFDRPARATQNVSMPIATLPAALRLALEMAAHEDLERRALDGELAELEQAWKDAEEIAAIADDLLLPDSVHTTLRKLRAD